MADELFNEAKKRILAYMTENFPTTEEGKMLKEAKKRVRKKKEFYIHFAIYIPTMILLTAISIFVTPQVWWWFLFPAGGWGLAVLIHYIDVFGLPGIGRLDEDWETFQIEQEFRKLKYRKEMQEYLTKGLPERAKEEEERLELKDLEKRMNEDDLV